MYIYRYTLKPCTLIQSLLHTSTSFIRLNVFISYDDLFQATRTCLLFLAILRCLRWLCVPYLWYGFHMEVCGFIQMILYQRCAYYACICMYCPIWFYMDFILHGFYSLKNGRIMLWQCPSVCPSVRPSVRVFRTFFQHALRYQIETWYMHLVGDTTCRVWVSSQLGHFDIVYSQM